MIVTRREDFPADAETTQIGERNTARIVPDDIRGESEERNENGMTRDDVFDQLADEDRVATSGRGSRLPLTDSDGGTTPTGYSSGVSSGSGAD